MCLDDYGWTPLHHAVFAMQEEAAAALLSYNANLISRCGAESLMQADGLNGSGDSGHAS